MAITAAGLRQNNRPMAMRKMTSIHIRVLYNLGNFWRRLVLPKKIENWSLTSLHQRLVKTGGRLVKHARYYWLLLAEGHLTRRVFAAILRRIWALPLPGGVSLAATGPAEAMAKKKKEGRWSVGKLGRDAPKLSVGSGPEGAPTTFHWYW
jgi:hypothetical protein